MFPRLTMKRFYQLQYRGMLVVAAQLLTWSCLVSMQLGHIPCGTEKTDPSTKDWTDMTDFWSCTLSVNLGFNPIAGGVFRRS